MNYLKDSIQDFPKWHLISPVPKRPSWCRIRAPTTPSSCVMTSPSRNQDQARSCSNWNARVYGIYSYSLKSSCLKPSLTSEQPLRSPRSVRLGRLQPHNRPRRRRDSRKTRPKCFKHIYRRAGRTQMDLQRLYRMQHLQTRLHTPLSQSTKHKPTRSRHITTIRSRRRKFHNAHPSRPRIGDRGTATLRRTDNVRRPIPSRNLAGTG